MQINMTKWKSSCYVQLNFSCIILIPRLLVCHLILGSFTNFSSATRESRSKADEILFGNMRSAGTEYKAHVTTTYRQTASGKNAGDRAKPNYNGPVRKPSIPVVYSTNYLDSFQSQPLYPVDGRNMSSLFSGLFGGYYLGQTMSPSHAYYKSYVPYREHFGNYYRTTKPSMVAPQKKVNPCLLDRWNRELPFTELPNMALQFLADDSVSGESTSQKAAFMFDLFESATKALVNYNYSAGTFEVSADAECHFTWIFFSFSPLLEALAPINWGDSAPRLDRPEDPMITSVRNILYSYSRLSKSHDYLEDVVNAAKTCLPRGDIISYAKVLPCLDFSFSPDEFLDLTKLSSIFQSPEICQKQLNPDMVQCNKNKQADGSCKIQHLVALNGFARNFYLCQNAKQSWRYEDLFPYKLKYEDLYGYTRMYVPTYATINPHRKSPDSQLGILGGCFVGFFVVLTIIVRCFQNRKELRNLITTEVTEPEVTENQPLNAPSVGIQEFHPDSVSGYHPQPIVTRAVFPSVETTGYHPTPPAFPHLSSFMPYPPPAPSPAEFDALPPSYESVYAVGDFSPRLPKNAD